MAVLRPWVRGQLFGKYLIVLVLLVSGALLISGLVGMYFSYQESQRAAIELQREKAVSAATRIEQFIREIERQIHWVIPPPVAASPSDAERRKGDYRRLLREALAITEVRYLDAAGREQLLVTRLGVDTEASGLDYSSEPAFRETRTGRTFFGPLYFRGESEPYMTIATPEAPSGSGVTVSEVNLKFIWDVVSQIKVGDAGYAYVVDSRGRLVAHPDITRILQPTDLSRLPQVQAAITPGQTRSFEEPARSPSRPSASPPDTVIAGDRLASFTAVDPPGWAVLVEQPLEEAFAPVQSSMVRTGLLMLLGLVISVAASVFLARRMVTPIRALQAGAARIGAGALDYQIDVRSGDEIEALARDFNRMAAQLSEIYGSLEQKVEERTRELADTAAQLQEKSRELETASQHKSEFLANMSHELRTPLNAIIGFSQVMLEGMAGDITEEQRECTKDILAGGRHLLSLINDILDLSKIEAGRMDFDPRPIWLPRAIDDGLTMIRQRAELHAITISVEVERGLTVIEADERKFKQVIFNLLSNAVKFTPAGGRIEISARRVGAGIQVAVHDTGVGIARADQDRIFEEFQQLSQADQGSAEGTGLGLTLAKKFVELHGGRIWVDSEAGVGSTFTFALPQRSGVGALIRDDREVDPGGHGVSRSTVLVVEDDPRAVDLLRLYLGRAGYNIAVASDGKEALDLARRLHPFAITLDVLLPGLDGWDFLAAAKADPRIADIPVVIVSMVDERGKGYALGAADYLVKPVTGDELLAALGRFAFGSERRDKVLAIDDDPIVLEFVETILGPAGYEVLRASAGEEGLEIAERELPSLIILDLLMPGLDGFTVVDRLRSSGSTSSIPIIILTSKSMTAEDKKRLEGRITYLAEKTEFDADAFVDVVRSLCPTPVV